MFFKILVVIFLIVILYCLFSALFYLVKEDKDKNPKAMVVALSWRIGLSVALFVVLLIAYGLGWIHPHTIMS